MGAAIRPDAELRDMLDDRCCADCGHGVKWHMVDDGCEDCACDASWSDVLLPIVHEARAEVAALAAELADTWDREAAPYLPGGERHASATLTIVARAHCRSMDADRLRQALNLPPAEAP